VEDFKTAPDRTLVEQAAAGDEWAFRELVHRHRRAVAGVVIAMLGAGDDADDVAQETFVRLSRSLHRFRGESSVRTYLIRIAMNRAIDVLRRERFMARWLRLDADPDASRPELTTVPADDIDADDERALVRRAVLALEPKYRAVVVLRYLENQSTRETAHTLNVPEGTVMSRLKRALAKLEVILRPAVDV
jgi:RNA polymerase sigma-70 factor (ECF subfamily)